MIYIGCEDGNPRISDIAVFVTEKNNAVGPILVTIDDADTQPDLLNITATSSNETLVPVSNTVFADFSGDGHLDFATANSESKTMSVLMGKGDGTFLHFQGSPIEIGSESPSLVTVDFNGDGLLDLAGVNGRNSKVVLLEGNGDGTFGGVIVVSINNPGPHGNGTSGFGARTYGEARPGATRADSRTRDAAHASVVRERVTDAGAHWWRDV